MRDYSRQNVLKVLGWAAAAGLVLLFLAPSLLAVALMLIGMPIFMMGFGGNLTGKLGPGGFPALFIGFVLALFGGLLLRAVKQGNWPPWHP
jgi:hypothetical protein